MTKLIQTVPYSENILKNKPFQHSDQIQPAKRSFQAFFTQALKNSDLETPGVIA